MQQRGYFVCVSLVVATNSPLLTSARSCSWFTFPLVANRLPGLHLPISYLLFNEASQPIGSSTLHGSLTVFNEEII